MVNSAESGNECLTRIAHIYLDGYPVSKTLSGRLGKKEIALPNLA